MGWTLKDLKANVSAAPEAATSLPTVGEKDKTVNEQRAAMAAASPPDAVNPVLSMLAGAVDNPLLVGLMGQAVAKDPTTGAPRSPLHMMAGAVMDTVNDVIHGGPEAGSTRAGIYDALAKDEQAHPAAALAGGIGSAALGGVGLAKAGTALATKGVPIVSALAKATKANPLARMLTATLGGGASGAADWRARGHSGAIGGLIGAIGGGVGQGVIGELLPLAVGFARHSGAPATVSKIVKEQAGRLARTAGGTPEETVAAAMGRMGDNLTLADMFPDTAANAVASDQNAARPIMAYLNAMDEVSPSQRAEADILNLMHDAQTAIEADTELGPGALGQTFDATAARSLGARRAALSAERKDISEVIGSALKAVEHIKISPREVKKLVRSVVFPVGSVPNVGDKAAASEVAGSIDELLSSLPKPKKVGNKKVTPTFTPAHVYSVQKAARAQARHLYNIPNPTPAQKNLAGIYSRVANALDEKYLDNIDELAAVRHQYRDSAEWDEMVTLGKRFIKATGDSKDLLIEQLSNASRANRLGFIEGLADHFSDMIDLGDASVASLKKLGDSKKLKALIQKAIPELDIAEVQRIANDAATKVSAVKTISKATSSDPMQHVLKAQANKLRQRLGRAIALSWFGRYFGMSAAASSAYTFGEAGRQVQHVATNPRLLGSLAATQVETGPQLESTLLKAVRGQPLGEVTGADRYANKETVLSNPLLYAITGRMDATAKQQGDRR